MKKIPLSAVLMMMFFCSVITNGWAQNHIEEMSHIRSSMTEIGGKLPEIIKAAKPEDIRTLERVFEINNYALMTIESYLKMLKVSALSGKGLNKDITILVNKWLQFIASYCENDIIYLNEAKNETKNKTTAYTVESERDCIARLMEAAKKGIVENSSLFPN
ncbi:MAG: hypothetical protein Q7S30_01050 [Candidatus Omnitrophota bacterium]|nr:hypothetical protein [Candidatus Omnitrophota bacterium]